MNKIEFIEFVLQNGYQYAETKTEINIDKVIDDLGNITLGISYNKMEKTFGISEERNVNKDEDVKHNRWYVLNEIELKIIKYLAELLESEVKE